MFTVGGWQVVPSRRRGASPRSEAVIVAELWRSWAGLVGDDHRGDRRGRVRTIAAVWCGGVGRSRAQGGQSTAGSGDRRRVVAVVSVVCRRRSPGAARSGRGG